MTPLNIDAMSTTEKISAMEQLWDDLCHSAESVTSPEWHHDILNSRESALREGTDQFYDWKDVKKDLLDLL